MKVAVWTDDAYPNGVSVSTTGSILVGYIIQDAQGCRSLSLQKGWFDHGKDPFYDSRTFMSQFQTTYDLTPLRL